MFPISSLRETQNGEKSYSLYPLWVHDALAKSGRVVPGGNICEIFNVGRARFPSVRCWGAIFVKVFDWAGACWIFFQYCPPNCTEKLLQPSSSCTNKLYRTDSEISNLCCLRHIMMLHSWESSCCLHPACPGSKILFDRWHLLPRGAKTRKELPCIYIQVRTVLQSKHCQKEQWTVLGQRMRLTMVQTRDSEGQQ